MTNMQKYATVLGRLGSRGRSTKAWLTTSLCLLPCPIFLRASSIQQLGADRRSYGRWSAGAPLRVGARSSMPNHQLPFLRRPRPDPADKVVAASCAILAALTVIATAARALTR